eukprot:10258445-Alexandrium_andersonii.AAC.1
MSTHDLGTGCNWQWRLDVGTIDQCVCTCGAGRGTRQVRSRARGTSGGTWTSSCSACITASSESPSCARWRRSCENN